ncbi:MAG: choice-of-anchor I family protein [Clostridia bacterium]|nr:choice-of-anchor I family protein [Clostridia bacterium]
MTKSVKLKVLSAAMAVTLTATTALSGVGTVFASDDTQSTGFENGSAKLDITQTGRYVSGMTNADGGVMEIVTYNTKTGFAYTVNGQSGFLAAIPISEIEDNGTVQQLEGNNIDIKALVEAGGYKYGDMTSVAVSPDGTQLAVAIQSEDYSANGKAAVFKCNDDGTLTLLYIAATGVQPDMITFTPDGSKILTANEGEPRLGYASGTVDPKGSVTVINTATGESSDVDFNAFDSEDERKKLTDSGIVLKKNTAPSVDLEPEYIATTNTTAYVSLQEANAIAVLDFSTNTFKGIYSVGFENYSEFAVDIDKKDEVYSPKKYDSLRGIRMPDGISLVTVDGTDYILTANEGDSRDWNGYLNEDERNFGKGKTSPTGKITAENSGLSGKVVFFDASDYDGLESDKDYLFGGRSFTMFRVTESGLEEVFTSGNDFESLTSQYIPSHFNCSNDDITTDDRSGKKGPEPESVVTGTVGGRTYAFIALERIGGIMAYDITDPTNVKYVNYINSRDFSEDIAGDDSPEGLCFISSDESKNGKSILLAACEVSGTVALYDLTSANNGTVILYTNDVHAAIDNYPALAAYRQQMINSGYKTYLVDAGDAIQGEIVSSMTDGQSIVEIMNLVGFDFAAIGNHEFDYGMDRFKQLSGLAENDVQAKYEYLSANFIDLSTNKTVFEPYKIVEANGKKIAILGISTPETYTKSTPKYFQDENGNFIYSFSEDKSSTPENEFIDTIQSAIDKANEEADIVIALGHLGTDSGSQPYCSTDLIANTTGLDAFIDGHSHSTIPAETVNDKNGEPVVLTSTGTKLKSFGKMTISPEGTIETELIDPTTVTADSPESVKNAYDKTETIVNDYRTQVEEFANVKIGFAEVPMYITDPATNNRMIRNRETNLGDFVSDAYRAATGADIAIANGGGIRADVLQGDVTRKNLMDVNAFKNQISVYEVTGQQILDALEWSARKPLNEDKTALTENGGFLHTSGLTYEINLTVEESPAIADEKGSYLGIDDTKQRRVQNVIVNGEPIDPTKKYTLAGSSYTIQDGGDGYTMFDGCKVVIDGVGNDQDLLCKYLEEDLGGVVTSEQYGNPYGEGRIKIITSSEPEISKPVTDTSKPSDTSTSSDNNSQTVYTGDNMNVILLFAVFITSGVAIVVFKIPVSKK